MNITLNIGLQVSKHYLPDGVAGMQWKYEYIRNYLEKAFGAPLCIGMALSTTETTVVVQYSNVEVVLQKLFRLSRELQQDCIAYRIQDDVAVLGGALVGDYAHEWNHGIFNEAYFVQATF